MGKAICHCWVGGINTKRGCKGGFQLDCFQNMDDPLADPDPTLRPLIKDVRFDLISFEFL